MSTFHDDMSSPESIYFDIGIKDTSRNYRGFYVVSLKHFADVAGVLLKRE